MKRSKLKQFNTFAEMERFVNENSIEVTQYFQTPNIKLFCIFYRELE